MVKNNNLDKDVWNIYGNKYNLKLYIESNTHPGGNNILEKVKNIDDISALFETYHAFSDINKIKSILKKYKIENDNEPNNDTNKLYDFSNYHVLLNKIKEIYPNRASIKCNTFFVIQNIFVFILYINLYYLAFFSNFNIYFRCICSSIRNINDVFRI